MKQYAKEVNNELQYAVDSDFIGIPNWRSNPQACRRKNFLPLVGEPEPREGYTATPSRWHVVQQSETRIEPRQTIVEDWETDQETGERRKVGEHTEMVDTEITIDTSYIQIDEWQYTENPPEPEPEQQEDISAQLEQVKDLIMSVAEKYHAEEAIMSMDDFNIPAIEQLIEQYEVTDEDKAKISYAVNFVVLDLMGKIRMTWYDIWNERVKPALNEMFRQRKAATI